MEVANRIHRIEAPLGDRIVCIYVLVGDEHVLIVDTGLANTPAESILPYLKAKEIDIDSSVFVLTSHADNDHNGGNQPLSKALSKPLFLCHTLDQLAIESNEVLISNRYDEWAEGHGMPLSEDIKQWVRDNTKPRPMDIVLQGGETLRLGDGWQVKILHTPGHSRGHVTVYDEEQQAAIIADAALWNSIPNTEGKSVLPPTYRYVDLYSATLNRLLNLPISLLLTSHYPVYKGNDAHGFLRESLNYVHGVDETLTQLLKSATSKRTLQQIIQDISPKIGDWPDSAAMFLMYPLTGHLERMERVGLVEQSYENGLIHYDWR